MALAANQVILTQKKQMPISMVNAANQIEAFRMMADASTRPAELAMAAAATPMTKIAMATRITLSASLIVRPPFVLFVVSFMPLVYR